MNPILCCTVLGIVASLAFLGIMITSEHLDEETRRRIEYEDKYVKTKQALEAAEIKTQLYWKEMVRQERLLKQYQEENQKYEFREYKARGLIDKLEKELKKAEKAAK